MPKVKRKLHRALKTLFCPDCGKRFANETRVLQHLNQPSSACRSWTNTLSHLHRRDHPNGPLVEPRSQPCQNYDEFLEGEIVSGASAPGGFGDPSYYPHQDRTPTPVVDSHPHTPSVYPGGTCFMGQFFNDRYATFRQQNLYYPFASRVDWQLASWLLCSRLSMAAINDFLSLELVGPLFLFVCFFEVNLYLRLSSFPYLFVQQRSFAFVQKCYHLDPTGNLTHSILNS